MAWNGLGQYLLNPAFSPEQNGDVIDATRYNGLTSDIAAGITACLAKNGENVPTANLPMGNRKHTGAAPATAAGEYLTFGQEGVVTPQNYGTPGTTGNGVVDDSNALRDALAARYNVVGYAGSTYRFKDVLFSDNRFFDGLKTRFTGEVGGTNAFKLSGFSTTLRNVYGSSTANLSAQAIKLAASDGAVIENIHLENADNGGLYLVPDNPAATSVVRAFISNILVKGVKVIAFRMGSSVNDCQFTNLYLSGYIDYVLGLGKPRAGSLGWYQNTPVVSGLAVGGHQVHNITCIGLQEGFHITDAQYTRYSKILADSCSSYGLIVDGASSDLEFTDAQIASTMGIRVSGSAVVNFGQLKTKLNGVVPPWGQAAFYDSAGPYYDLTIQNTAVVTIDGDNWIGDKRVIIDPTANLIVTGGQWIGGSTETNVAPTGAPGVFIKPGGGYTTTESEATMRTQRAGWLFFAQASAAAAPAGADSYTYNIRVAGVNKLQVVISAGNFSNKAWGVSLPVVANQEISIQLIVSAGAPTTRHDCQAQFLRD